MAYCTHENGLFSHALLSYAVYTVPLVAIFLRGTRLLFPPSLGLGSLILMESNQDGCMWGLYPVAAGKGEEAVLLLHDYKAAFDTIVHDILLSRLHDRYGICGSAEVECV